MNSNKISVNEDSFEIFLEREISAIANSKKTFKKMNKWLKCGLTCVSDATFVKIFSTLMIVSEKKKIKKKKKKKERKI